MDRPVSHPISVLERILGLGRFQLADAGDGPKREVRWPCGCQASEAAAGRYDLHPCGTHRDEL